MKINALNRNTPANFLNLVGILSNIVSVDSCESLNLLIIIGLSPLSDPRKIGNSSFSSISGKYPLPELDISIFGLSSSNDGLIKKKQKIEITIPANPVQFIQSCVTICLSNPNHPNLPEKNPITIPILLHNNTPNPNPISLIIGIINRFAIAHKLPPNIPTGENTNVP
ncbi:hypothetical protein RB653_007646 [Dictyostelium firmibasis]|uniref:Uncharacterized protein n=1 Tax=Dictyostelium firmibasis TaxID=79012 RepID=A0AAN7YUU6_9MYCE